MGALGERLEARSRVLPAQCRWARWRRSQPLSQARQAGGRGRSGDGALQASVRATMGVTALGGCTRDAGAALEEEWAVAGMREDGGRGDGHEGFGIGSLGAETGGPHGRHRLSLELQSLVIRAMATTIAAPGARLAATLESLHEPVCLAQGMRRRALSSLAMPPLLRDERALRADGPGCATAGVTWRTGQVAKPIQFTRWRRRPIPLNILFGRLRPSDAAYSKTLPLRTRSARRADAPNLAPLHSAQESGSPEARRAAQPCQVMDVFSLPYVGADSACCSKGGHLPDLASPPCRRHCHRQPPAVTLHTQEAL